MEQILSNLYALRAGLSVISQKSDEIKQIKIKQISELLGIGDNLKEYYVILVNSINDSAYEYFKSKNDLNYYLQNPIFKRRYEFEQLTIKYNTRYWEETIIENILNEKITDEAKKKYINICYENFGSSERLLLNYALVQWLMSGFYKELLVSEYNRLVHKLFKPKDKIAEIERNINDIPALQNKVKAIENSGKPEIKEICDSIAYYFDALVSEFNSLIDFRDWDHLDLVIYYFETHRADSIKEALQLLDRELQTRRIEDLIIAATEQICKTLTIGFKAVCSTMEMCCNKLTAQISMSASTISSQLSNLTNMVNMGNALQSKANVTSERLMRDVMYIKNSI